MAPVGRRGFLVGVVGFGAVAAARALGAQQPGQTNFAPMEEGAYRPTLRPSKSGATPRLTDAERDALEHRIKCQCSCTLDVYTCRTTDFTCPVSPAMHRDVLRLIEGGYGADEILAAFVETYGEVALTEPKKEGFNWAGYLAPGFALATGGVVLTLLIRKWGLAARAAGVARGSVPRDPVPGVSSEEMAQLERAIREER